MEAGSGSMSGSGEDIFNFQIEEEELEEMAVSVDSGNEGIDDRWCLVGRFLSNRIVDFEKMQNILASLWQPGIGMFVKQVDNNRFLFQFYHEVDIKRVIDGSPWTYDRMQLIIERLPVGGDPKTLTLNTLDIWIQMHDVQPGCMTEATIKGLGNAIGKFLESDPKNFIGVWREYLRMRITIDITKPLRRRLKLTKDDGTWFWVNFKYERAPTFCFICGIIGHTERFCSKLFHQSVDTVVKPYGEFMRAQPQRNHKNIGARWLRTRGWTPPVAAGGSSGSMAGQRNPNMEGSGGVGSASNQEGSDLLNGATVSGVIRANQGAGKYGNNAMGNQGENQGMNRGKDIMSDQEDILVIYDSKKRKVGEDANVGHVGGDGLKFEGSFTVEAQGHSGGVALIWKNNEEVVIDSFSKNHIDCLVTFEGHQPFRFTGIYSEPNRSLRQQTWTLIRTLHARSMAPWCIMGDFNNVLHQSEKLGGNPYPTWLIDGFQEVVQRCGLCDLDMLGHPFTWEKSRDTPNWIEAKLDRAMCSQSWLNVFSTARLFNLEVSPSDHCPLLLDVQHCEPRDQPRPFKFENCWCSHQDCETIIRDSWGTNGGTRLDQKIQQCGQALQAWGKGVTGIFLPR
uniref:CCHC-type domain-containing protein n=1 Tax=Cannabis sativa TaxID=3483 RepID=A0A803QS68_CANSA